MAMAAMMPMIATTMRSSISEKPSCRLFFITLLLKKPFPFSALDRLLCAEHDFLAHYKTSCVPEIVLDFARKMAIENAN
jgi:hypothetical protein